MIPEVIHYCWFGGSPLPPKFREYISSWKKFCPGYEIREWNETNFDVTENRYCREAYEAGEWAFVSDYARLKIMYDNGGVYLDTDVEMIRDITPLLCGGFGFIGFQNSLEVNTGLGFAAPQYCGAVKAMLDIYENRRFVLPDGTYGRTPCPSANTLGLMKCGLRTGEPRCRDIQTVDGMKVYPSEYFNPLDYDTHTLTVTTDTYLIHHYSSSWMNGRQKLKRKFKHLVPHSVLRRHTLRVAQKNLERMKSENGKDGGR